MRCLKLFGFLLGFSSLGFFTERAAADLVTCPAYVAKNKDMAIAIKYLQSIQGSYQLGQCKVELHVCGAIGIDNAAGSLVGDLLITDKHGRESYLQLDFPNEQNSQRQVEIQNGHIMFHYEFDDEHPDPIYGARESIRLEFLKSENKKMLVSLEEGWYSTKDWRHRQRGSVYNWTLCHGAVTPPGMAAPGQTITALRGVP